MRLYSKVSLSKLPSQFIFHKKTLRKCSFEIVVEIYAIFNSDFRSVTSTFDVKIYNIIVSIILFVCWCAHA